MWELSDSASGTFQNENREMTLKYTIPVHSMLMPVSLWYPMEVRSRLAITWLWLTRSALCISRVRGCISDIVRHLVTQSIDGRPNDVRAVLNYFSLTV